MRHSEPPRERPLLGPLIVRRHAVWTDEIGGALASVRAPDPGLWDRWAAVRYLKNEFLAELRRERAVAEALAAGLPAAQRDRLWACGEYLELLVRYLHELSGSPDALRTFQLALAKLDRAFVCWRREFEGSLGPLEQSALPAALLETLEPPVRSWGLAGSH